MQKLDIYNAIKEHGHVTVNDLLTMPSLTNISRATIYRNLTILAEQGLIKQVKIGFAEYYEAVKSNHYHLQCTKCHRVYDVDPTLINVDCKLSDVVDLNITVYGICNSCKERK